MILLSKKLVIAADGIKVNTETTTLITKIPSNKPRMIPKSVLILPSNLILLKSAVSTLLNSLKTIFKRKNSATPAIKVQSNSATVEPAK